MKERKLPSPRVLRRLLDYDPETGELRWKERPVWMFKKHHEARSWNTRRRGRLASSKCGNDYLRVTVLYRNFYAHRVVWALCNGKWPSQQIDHINGNRADNRIENLRDVECAQNQRNMGRSIRNKSGVTGVWWDGARSKWQATIWVRKKVVHLGRFKKKREAIAARKAAETKYNFHPNHGRSK